MQDFVIIDEAQFPLGKSLIDTQCGQPKIAEALQTARAFLVSIIISSNTPGDLIETSHVNTNQKFMLKLPDAKNVRAMANTLGLTQSQTAYASRMDEKDFEAIISAKNPYKIKLNPFPLELRPISDEEVRKRSKEILSGYEIKRNTPHPQEPDSPTIKEENKKRDELSPESKSLLLDICNNPTHSKTQHYKNGGMSMDKGNTQTKKMIAQGMVEEVAVNMGGNKKLTKILYLTSKGYEAIDASPTSDNTRGDGPAHRFWTTLYHDQLIEAGIKSEISHRLNGKETDIGIIHPNGEITAIEISITTTAEWESSQAQKDLEKGYSHVLVVADKKKAEKIATLIPPHIQQRVIVSPFVPNINQKITKKGKEKKK